MFTLFCAQ